MDIIEVMKTGTNFKLIVQVQLVIIILIINLYIVL